MVGTPFVVTRSAPAYLLLNPLIWLLWILDFVVWLVMALLWPPVMMKFLKCQGLLSFEQSDGKHRYRTKDRDGSLMKYPFSPKENTVHAVMQKAFRDYTHLPCMGTRKFVRMHKPENARFPLKVFDDTTWATYGDVREAAAAFGCGLRALGLQPLPLDMAKDMTTRFTAIAGPHAIIIFEETCAEWMTSCLGAMGQSIVVATSYSTLGIGAVAEALNQTGAPLILCNYRDVGRVAKACESACSNLKTIVYTRHDVEPEAPDHEPQLGTLQVMSYDALLNLGRANDPAATAAGGGGASAGGGGRGSSAAVGGASSAGGKLYSEPHPDHVGLIMYTSGSTGKPKGVMLKHSAIVAAISSLENYFSAFSTRASTEHNQETYLAYLPAAHILEFSAEMSMLTHGAKMGYSDPKTISSAGALRLMPDGVTLNGKPSGFGNHPPGGIQEFAPTVMAAVPKIWDILKKGVEDNVGKGSPVVKALFQAAFSARNAALQQGRESPLLGLIFKKVGGLLGGRIKIAVTGGGPISPEVQNFVRVAMHFNLVQGYALTETCSAGTVQPGFSMVDGVAGRPVPSVQMRLNDCNEQENGTYKFVDRAKKPYLSTDPDHLGQPCLGRGEVWIKGASVSSGYYLEEEKTRAEFDSDGWFHTGDIAIWTPEGQLKIVDRLKNLVKLKGGEYVAIESMEATYAQSVFVNGKNGGLMCYADADMDKPIALVQVNDYELKKWAEASGVAFNSVEDLCANDQAIAMVTADLNAIGKGKLGGNEALASVALLPGTGSAEDTGPNAPWTPENGYLTAANKLARAPVKEGFAAAIAKTKPKAIR